MSQCRGCSGLSHQACRARAGQVAQHRRPAGRCSWSARRRGPAATTRGPRASACCSAKVGERPAVVRAPPQRGVRGARRRARPAPRPRSAPGRKYVGHLVHLVDEREGAHLLELLAQREDEQQRELREVGHRPAHVAEHDQLGAVRALGPVVGGQRDAAGRDRGADGTPEVERAAALGVALLGQPGGQPARQRVDLAAHLLEVGLAGRGEVEAVDARAGPPRRPRGRGPSPRRSGGGRRPRPARVKRADPARRAVRRASSSTRPSASSACDDLVDQRRRARPAGGRCTPTS